MLDFELIKNENIVKKIDVSNKNEFSEILIIFTINILFFN